MSIIIGDPIELSFRISIDGIPASGRSIEVRVVKTADGTELLGTTAVSETSESGLYTYIWTSPPTERIQLMVIYKDVATGKSFVEFLQIEERRQMVTEIAGTVLTSAGTEDTITGIVEDVSGGISGVIEGDEALVASVSGDEATTVVEDSGAVSGTVQDGDVSGTVDCT